MKYAIQNKPIDVKKVKSLITSLELPPIVAALMVARGIDSISKTNSYLKADNVFFDPFLLKGMDQAADRILLAKNNNEKVYVCGDYDVDGITSTAILLRFFKKAEINGFHLLPTQMQGHGLSVELVTEIHKNGGNVIVTVDNGSTSFDAVDCANKFGIDVIITDHHDISKDGVPKALAVINPKQSDCPSPFKYLSGGGIALYFARGLAKKFGKEELITEDLIVLASISTVADIVPLTEDNRSIVKLGL